MTFFRLTDSALPPGMKPWTPAEREALLAEVDAVHEVTTATKPSAKADPHGWQAVIARVADPARFQAATTAEKS